MNWTSESDSIYNRCHWYVLDKIGKTNKEHQFREINKAFLNNDSVIAYSRERSAGRARVIKSGNVVQVYTAGVKSFRLLLSPEHFNFNEPVIVYTNGLLSFQGKVRKDLKALFKWNLIDEDRSMLFAAEIEIKP